MIFDPARASSPDFERHLQALRDNRQATHAAQVATVAATNQRSHTLALRAHTNALQAPPRPNLLVDARVQRKRALRDANPIPPSRSQHLFVSDLAANLNAIAGVREDGGQPHLPHVNTQLPATNGRGPSRSPPPERHNPLSGKALIREVRRQYREYKYTRNEHRRSGRNRSRGESRNPRYRRSSDDSERSRSPVSRGAHSPSPAQHSPSRSARAHRSPHNRSSSPASRSSSLASRSSSPASRDMLVPNRMSPQPRPPAPAPIPAPSPLAEHERGRSPPAPQEGSKGILAAGPATVIEHHIIQRGQDHHPRSTARVTAGHVQQLRTAHGVLIHDPHQAGAMLTLYNHRFKDVLYTPLLAHHQMDPIVFETERHFKELARTIADLRRRISMAPAPASAAPTGPTMSLDVAAANRQIYSAANTRYVDTRLQRKPPIN